MADLRLARSRSGGRTLHILAPDRALEHWSVCGVHCPPLKRKPKDGLPVCRNCVSMVERRA